LKVDDDLPFTLNPCIFIHDTLAAIDRGIHLAHMSNESSYTDLNRESRSLMQSLGKGQANLMKSFQGLHHAALEADALDGKVKELIALAIGISSQCQRCIGLHVEAALKQGATAEEIRETIGVATMMGGGPALMYGLEAEKALAELE